MGLWSKHPSIYSTNIFFHVSHLPFLYPRAPSRQQEIETAREMARSASGLGLGVGLGFDLPGNPSCVLEGDRPNLSRSGASVGLGVGATSSSPDPTARAAPKVSLHPLNLSINFLYRSTYLCLGYIYEGCVP